MYKAKTKFLWYKELDEIKTEDLRFCDDWESKDLVQHVKGTPTASEELNNIEKEKSQSKPQDTQEELDINNDGKVDGKDVSLAGKVLARGRKRLSRKK